MKVKIEIDATPEELRTFFGLPDISSLQETMLEDLKEKIKTDSANYDPRKIMEPFLPEHLRSIEGMQQSFWNNVAKATGKSSFTDEDNDK